METGSIIFRVPIALGIYYAVSVYNHLVRIKHNVSRAWSNIDVLLKQIHDVIRKRVAVDNILYMTGFFKGNKTVTSLIR